MSSNLQKCIIFLTYKGKLLLLSKGNRVDIQPYNPWGFIEKDSLKDTSEKDIIVREVLRETKIKLSNVTLIADVSYSDTAAHVFHAQLTDLHVNSIQRDDESLLEFYSLSELKKLNLKESTKNIYLQCQTALEHLMN